MNHQNGAFIVRAILFLPKKSGEEVQDNHINIGSAYIWGKMIWITVYVKTLLVNLYMH